MSEKVKFVELTQRHINDWCDALPEPDVMTKMRMPKYNFLLVQAAAEAGWFLEPIDPEKVADMKPAEVTRLAKAVTEAYAKAEEISPS